MEERVGKNEEYDIMYNSKLVIADSNQNGFDSMQQNEDSTQYTADSRQEHITYADIMR